MHSDTHQGDSDSPCELPPWDDSRDLLDEVREATEGSGQRELHEFVCLVSQVIDLHEAENPDAPPRDQEVVEFVTSSLRELRLVVEAGKDDSQRLNSLRDQAIDRWGERLVPLSRDAFEEPSADTDRRWDAETENDADPDETAAIMPSAKDIQSLLSALSQSPITENEQRTPPKHSSADKAAAEENDDAEASRISVASLDPELREAFLDDAQVCVSSMEEALLRLESNPQHGDSLNQICRDLHTLKGASASVGLTTLADQLHAAEDSIRDDQAAGREPAIDALLCTVDSIRTEISADAVTEPQHTIGREFDPPHVQAAIHSPAQQLDSISEGPANDESVRVKSSQLNRLMDMLAELVMLRNRRETELSQMQDIYHELIGSVSKMRLLSNEGQVQDSANSSLQLSEVASDVLEVAQNVRDCARPVAEGNAAVSLFIRQFRQELVELRRTPIAGLFQRLQRAVRDAAQLESKEVRLCLLGEDAGIERALQQRLYEPLLHIVRNSVCHGIETPAERTRGGKAAAGTITLEAKSTSDLFVIEIRDDGRGLDYDAIRRRGIDSGLLSADQSASREELAQLIFQPGFSTRQSANQVAGRGVGMDVVASTLRRMRGWLEVESDPQQGTRIRLSFPLPSVIQHAMVFRSAGQLFALPMQSVKSAGELEHDSAFLVFSELLGAENGGAQSGDNADSTENCQQIVLACEPPASIEPSAGRSFVTLLVDEIVGPEEVVVRPLPPLMRSHPFCSGASLSGMGQIVLLLDARRIVQSQHHRLRHGEASPGWRDGDQDRAGPPLQPHVLVVDDSLSARKRVVRSLRRYPIEITEASDGKQAMALLKTKRFDAVFSDLEMPHVSGMELLAEVNSANDESAPPVVIISSRGEDEYTSQAKQLGVSSYLIKPLADEALDGALEEIPCLRLLTNNPLTNITTRGEVR